MERLEEVFVFLFIYLFLFFFCKFSCWEQIKNYIKNISRSYSERKKLNCQGGLPKIWTPKRDQSGRGSVVETLRNYEGDGKEKVKKTIVLMSKTTTLQVHHACFVHFFAVPAQQRHEMTTFWGSCVTKFSQISSLKFIRLLRVVFSSQQRRYWGSNNDSK